MIRRKGKLAIVVASTPDRRDLFEATNATKEFYCRNHGLDFVFTTQDRGVLPYWNKPFVVFDELKGREAVLWTDDDSLIVNQDFDLAGAIESADKPVMLCKDEGGWNSGIVLFKADSRTWELLEWWNGQSTNPIYQKANWDQNALVDYIGHYPEDFGEWDGRIFNAHHPSFPEPAPNLYDKERTFIVHIAGGPGRKKELMQSGEWNALFSKWRNK